MLEQLDCTFGNPSKACLFGILTLPETNSLHLKMDGWNTINSFWVPLPIFRGDLLASGTVNVTPEVFFMLLNRYPVSEAMAFVFEMDVGY